MRIIPSTDKNNNEDVVRETNSQTEVVTRIRKRQSTFSNHAIRRGKVEYAIARGRLNEEEAGETKRNDTELLGIKARRQWHTEISGCSGQLL